MSADEYEFSGTLTFSNEELKKELHQIALNGLKAFCEAYETAYLGSTNLGNGIKISVEDNTRLPYATLGASAADAKELYDLAVAMDDSYEAAKVLCTLETRKDINAVDLVSGITTSISNLKKIADDMGDTLGVTSKKAGIITSTIGFAGALIATFDGTTKAEKDALVKSGIDLVGEGLKLGLKAIPGVGLLGSVGIDVGVELAKILVENIYQVSENLSDNDNFDKKYREGLVSVDSAMDTTLSKHNIPKCTKGDDLIWNENSGVSINALSGNDRITNEGSNVTIIGSSGNDEIVNWGSGASIVAGTGKDSIFTYGSDNPGSEYFGGELSTIYAGDGNDYVENNCSNNYIDLGNDNDYVSIIFNHNSLKGLNNTVIGGAGNDTIELWGNPNIDYIQNYYVNENCIVQGSKGDDVISLSYYYPQNAIIQYSVGDGNDTIYGYRSYLHYGEIICDIIQISGSEYETIDNGNDVIIKVGDGSILLKGADITAVNIQGTLAADTVSTVETAKNIQVANSNTIISGTKYNDTIINGTSGGLTPRPSGNEKVTIAAGAGIDSITNCGKNVSVNAGAGDDRIDNYGTNVTIRGDSDNDYIVNWYGILSVIDGGNGDDRLTNMFIENSIYGGNGNDDIVNGTCEIGDTVYYGHYSLLDGGAGDDEITNQCKKVTISGGKGNDIISDSGSNNTFVYSNGDGNDTIFGVDSSDTLQITGAKYTTTKSGSNLIIGVGSGSILVYGGANVAFKIDGTLKGNDDNGLSVKNSVLTAAKTFTGNKIDLSNYAATKVNASAVSQAVSIIGSAVANSIKGGKGADTILGGAGNDTVSLGGGADVYIYSAGNDFIQNYTAGADKIKLSGASITSSSISGSNVILKTSKGNITVKSGKGKNITVIDSKGKETTNIYPVETLPAGISIKSSVLTASSSFTGKKIDLADYPTATKVNASALSKAVSIVGSDKANSLTGGKGADKLYGNNGNDTIYGGAGADSLFGETGNDKLYGDAGNDTISGGAGNDTLTGGAGNDTFIYSAGKDVITDYAAGDKIKIDGKISKTSYSGKNVVFTIGSGTLTVKNGKGTKISVTDSSGTKTYSKTLDLFEDNNFVTEGAQISEITAPKVSVTQIQPENYAALEQNNKTFLTFAQK